MDLSTLRNRIDEIDSEILKLFIERMDVCRQVGEYKKTHDLPVMQGGREQQIIDNIRANSPDDLKDGAAVLFQNIMDISKSIQNIGMAADKKREHSSFYLPEGLLYFQAKA